MPVGDADFWWNLLERFLSTLGLAAAAIAGWVFKNYRADQARLTRVEEALRLAEDELGHLREMRLFTENGRLPLRKVEELEDMMGRLAEDMTRWERTHDKIDARTETLNSTITTLTAQLAAAIESINWLKEHANHRHRT